MPKTVLHTLFQTLFDVIGFKALLDTKSGTLIYLPPSWVTGKKGYGDRFGYFKKLKGTERLQHIALVSSSDVGALENMQQVLRKHRGNWIIEVASAAAWGYYGHR